ncbi:hypothetical protein [Sedimentibacter sp. MB31-C6]|uniref:hypothetical protein n=1 Tax=Sedimentibacter sp. MB31-C6 TaxID=3109366 RepID=UPI002DDCBDBD|nr:hypothetical protein [Sedimentibacter sp. MB36-C1]WSI05501.1 hypothetical protein U8307_06845 [Sedimentibacter sp. MB36-C1]
MKEINIVLTQTNTLVSKTLKAFSKKPYNHISISFTEDCTDMYSFGRKITWLPLPGGFVRENINHGIFKLYPETKCKIYKLEVTDSEYNIIKRRLEKFINSPERFKYSILNLVLMYFNIPLKRDYYYVCSSFVTYLLWGIIPFNKEITLVVPDDYNTLELETIYEGPLFEYVNKKIAYSHF